MEFNAENYGSEIADILALGGGGTRLMPLVHTGLGSTEAREAVKNLRVPDAVRSGLYLYFSCWEEAHSTADAVETPDGYFWHAIVHRQEPDPPNAAWWFRKLGAHPIFPELAEGAAGYGYPRGPAWDPLGFIGFCGTAGKQPGSEFERLALRVQLLEWQLLFDHCARGSNC